MELVEAVHDVVQPVAERAEWQWMAWNRSGAFGSWLKDTKAPYGVVMTNWSNWRSLSWTRNLHYDDELIDDGKHHRCRSGCCRSHRDHHLDFGKGSLKYIKSQGKLVSPLGIIRRGLFGRSLGRCVLQGTCLVAEVKSNAKPGLLGNWTSLIHIAPSITAPFLSAWNLLNH